MEEAAHAVEERLHDLETELAATKDRHLRLAAEFDNYRKRVQRDQAEHVVRAQAGLLHRLIDVLDDLERVAHHMDNATLEALHEGVQLVERKLRTALETAGLERLDADNQTFDPLTMEALMTVPTDRPDEDELVADVFQPGYRYQGTLLRPARVRVKKYEA